MEQIDRDKVVCRLRNEPLIEHEFSLPMLADSLWASKGRALFYGTGLCNTHCLTVGVPFDTLAMVLVAQKLRLMLGLSEIIHHIADTHALCNFPQEKEDVSKKAEEVEATMKIVISRLGLRDFVVLRSSSFDASSGYATLMSSTNGGDGEYSQRELTDMLWYQKNHNVVLKLGWASQGFDFDERWYDNRFVSCFGRIMSFAYTKSGRSFSRKAVPYIATTEDDRIFLRPGERVQAKFDHASKHIKKNVISGAVNYFASICRLYDSLKLGEPLSRGSVPQKVQQIIDRIFE